MSAPATQTSDCWKRIGVQGDRSCPELQRHIHCRNCPVYSSAGHRLLSRPLPADYGREWARHYAAPPLEEAAETVAALVFRVGGEWLALPPALFLEVAAPRPIHSLPQRRSKAVLGLVNVRGELQIAMSLADLLGLGSTAASQSTATPRLLVGGREMGRFVFPVEEIHGVHRFPAAEVTAPPATVARALSSHTRGLFSMKDRAIGWLDEAALLATCERSVG